MEKRIFFFEAGATEGDPERKDVLGGKGASLMAMSKAGLPVPPGFTISTDCCRLYLEQDGKWPDGLEDEVKQYLARLEKSTGRRYGDAKNPLLVSVRSGAAQSMPGMMDTILNCGLSPEVADASPNQVSAWNVYTQFAFMFVKTVAGVEARELDEVKDKVGAGGAPGTGHYKKLFSAYAELYRERTDRDFPKTPWDALLECIEAVFNSWNNERAITYRREHDVRGLCGTAVNVQSMFPSRISGIVFTMNPNDVAADEMIIESSYGLGESVVSGDVTPDNFVVNRNDFQIKRRTIGHKAQVVAALGDMEKRDPDAASLTDAQVKELSGISMNVEKFFGKAMDIEWGWADGKFALLQSRSIRGLEIVEDVEIGRKEEIHRLKELANQKRKVWIIHNLAETLPAPTPLTWDIMRGFMTGNGGFGKLYTDVGHRPSQEVKENGFLELICGRIYADTSRAGGLFWDGWPFVYDIEEISKNPKLIDAAPTKFDPEQANGGILLRMPGIMRAMRKSTKAIQEATKTALKRLEEVLPPFLEWTKQKRAQDLKGLPTKDVVAELRARIERVLNQFGPESLKPGFYGAGAQAALETRLTQLMGREKGMHLLLTLTQGLEGDITVEQNQWLWETGRGRRTVKDFVERFGHRAVEEMELSKPRWFEDDSYVKQVVANYHGESVTAPHELHEKNAARRKEAEAKLRETLAEWGGSSFLEEVTENLKDAQALLPYRETGKFYLMMGYATIRMAIMELSRRWDLGRDVFFLQLNELEEYEKRKDDLQQKIKARKLRWQSARRLDMPEVIDSNDLENLGLPKKYDAATELKGEPIASGIATGLARLVKDPSEATDLGKDYVLVCHSTDPGWTALFVHARGLVVEQGGILSHGAIVARDFGIPAVVCPDAMRRIPDKSIVRVDGNRGLIAIVKQPGEEGKGPCSS